MHGGGKHAIIGSISRKAVRKYKVERETTVSRSLIAFDTDHIKEYVFGTNKLKEIRGASSILDWLNREETVEVAKRFNAEKIYALGGSALFIVDSQQADKLGKEVQKLYYEKTKGGTSITYAVQEIPGDDSQKVSVANVLRLLRLRLRLAKDNPHVQRTPERDAQEVDAGTIIALPSHALLCTCESCGANYAVGVAKDADDPDEDEGRYCRVCLGKRDEDSRVKKELSNAHKTPLSENSLWGRIIDALGKDYFSPDVPLPDRPKDFNVFRQFAQGGKEYLGLIYADANNMGQAFDGLELPQLQALAEKIDKAVFAAMGYSIRTRLPLRGNMFPFDVLLIGGDDIVIVTPADKALEIAYALAEQFQHLTDQQHTLSVGVVLAPVNYPFRLQHELVDRAIKEAKKAGAQQLQSVESGDKEQGSRVNFVVVTGNISLDYQKQYEVLPGITIAGNTDDFYATMRPYTLKDLKWLLDCVREGNERQLGRTKLHQLREAILKKNKTTAILESLMVLRNWKNEKDRDFIKQMAQKFDQRLTPRQQQMGTIFPWSLNGKESSDNLTIYRTPLLDFIELYDFVSS